MIKETEYRFKSDSYVNFLQYKGLKSYLFGLYKKEGWYYVWRPRYDKIWGRGLDTLGYDNYVNDYTDNLKEFVKKWTYIEDYFVEAEREQTRLEEKARKWNKDKEKRKGKITFP